MNLKENFTCLTSSINNNPCRHDESELREDFEKKRTFKIFEKNFKSIDTWWIAWTSNVNAGVVIGWRKSDVG